MPKDEWAKARAKDAARKRSGPFVRHDREKRRKAKHAHQTPLLVTIVPGTLVQVRKCGEPIWRKHIVRDRVNASISRRYGDTLYLHFKGWEIQFNRP